MAAKTLMTVQEFAQLKTAETEDYELVEGELIPLSTGTPRHSEIRGRVEAMLWFYFRQNPIGKHWLKRIALWRAIQSGDPTFLCFFWKI